MFHIAFLKNSGSGDDARVWKFSLIQTAFLDFFYQITLLMNTKCYVIMLKD